MPNEVARSFGRKTTIRILACVKIAVKQKIQNSNKKTKIMYNKHPACMRILFTAGSAALSKPVDYTKSTFVTTP